MVKHKILLVNDDGFLTKAFPLTYNALRPLGKVIPVVPEVPKSGGAHALTLHKPIFVKELKINDIKVYVINGTPVDAVHVARSILSVDPDLVVSGVNVGENTSVQNILYSGTIGAAIEAGLFGYPAIAFSADVDSDEAFTQQPYASIVSNIVYETSRFVLEHGWFEGVDALSINIPRTPKPLGAKLAKPQRIRFKQRYVRRVDPRGRPYFWLVGDKVTEEGTDSYYLEKGFVVVTPLRSDPTHPELSGHNPLPSKLFNLVKYLDSIIKSM